MPIITYANTIDWEMPLTQRPHHIFSELAKRGWTVHWIDINNDTHHSEYCRKVADNLFIFNNWEKYVQEYSGKIDVYFASWAYRWRDIEAIKPKMVAYDSLDLFEVNQPEERDMISRADVIFATTKTIRDFHKKHTNKKIHLCENGCFNNLRSIFFNVPEDIVNLPKPWILFSGALAMDVSPHGWVRYELVKKIPSKGSFIVVGKPWYISGSQLNELQRMGVRFLGTKPYRELQKYYAHCDVNVVPFVRNQIADNASPLKLIEASNQGTITVSSNIPVAVDFNKKYPEAVLISNNDNQFLKNIDRAYKSRNNKIAREQCYALADTQDWSKKVNVIENAILEYLHGF